MAVRGYNGFLVYYLGDGDRKAVLVNFGREWKTLSKEQLVEIVYDNMEAIEEDNVYRQWWDIHLLDSLEEEESIQ
jgi:predicted alpha-1,6-mannanase (GH76 family)